MTLNKKLIATAVGTALTVGLGVQTAQATHEILFPYVRKDANITTVLTMIGQAPAGGTILHAQYWTKSTTAANTAACEPSSREMPFTDQDMVTWDSAGSLGFPLFGDTTNGTIAPVITYASPRHGYLVVRVDAGSTYEPYAGYWMELDIANGGAHGDSAAHIPSNDDGNGITNAMQLNNNLARAVPFWPSSIVTTNFTVTPLGTQMETVENNTVVMQVVKTTGLQGGYDRNERGLDGAVPNTVRCVGRLTLAQLMPGMVGDATFAAGGGWGWLRNRGDGDTSTAEVCGVTAGATTGDCGAIVYQVDSSSAIGGKFASNATRLATDWGDGIGTQPTDTP